MKKIILFAIAVCFAGCSGTNDPTSYTFIKIMKDGSEQKEQFNAESDSAAIMHFVKAGMEDQGKTIERGILLNYKGDTLNTEKNAAKMMQKIFGVEDKEMEEIDEKIKKADSLLELINQL